MTAPSRLLPGADRQPWLHVDSGARRYALLVAAGLVSVAGFMLLAVSDPTSWRGSGSWAVPTGRDTCWPVRWIPSGLIAW
ncbi:MAG: hypothetical protein DLM71_08895 [Chloroflexi bacterium]|nr:MAG: hypothetical protein DLM71_08895 [Chloroflexota bacterium]